MVESPRQNLIRILQNAHAGELAAAFAYRGHWKSSRKQNERDEIKRIETEEWTHRECVFSWLEKLDAKPRPVRESIFWTIGRTLGIGCYMSGWFFPMYFAGRLESQNVQEYVDAANFARELGMDECVKDLLEMSAVEQKHEDYFRSVVQDHFLLPITKSIFRWG